MAAYSDLRAVQIHDALCQRQPQSTAVHAMRVRSPIQLFKNALQFIGRDAGSCIGHFDNDGSSVLQRADLHGIYRRCELQSIFDQAVHG